MEGFVSLMVPLAYIAAKSTFVVTPPLFWFLVGIAFCAAEFLLPKALISSCKLVALTIGIGGLITSFTLWWSAKALQFDWHYIMYEGLNYQIMYWMGWSITSLIWIRPSFLILRRPKFMIPDAEEAETLTEILPGKLGRVLYEGTSWQARCVERLEGIAANQKVYVLRREGNTLIVASETLFHS